MNFLKNIFFWVFTTSIVQAQKAPVQIKLTIASSDVQNVDTSSNLYAFFSKVKMVENTGFNDDDTLISPGLNIPPGGKMLLSILTYEHDEPNYVHICLSGVIGTWSYSQVTINGADIDNSHQTVTPEQCITHHVQQIPTNSNNRRISGIKPIWFPRATHFVTVQVGVGELPSENADFPVSVRFQTSENVFQQHGYFFSYLDHKEYAEKVFWFVEDDFPWTFLAEETASSTSSKASPVSTTGRLSLKLCKSSFEISWKIEALTINMQKVSDKLLNLHNVLNKHYPCQVFGINHFLPVHIENGKIYVYIHFF